MQTQYRQVGDTRTGIPAALKRPSGDAVDVSAPLTVKFLLRNSDGAVKVALTASNVSTPDASNGRVLYQPQAADVNEAGTYHAYFIVETEAGAQDTFPVVMGEFVIVIRPGAI